MELQGYSEFGALSGNSSPGIFKARQVSSGRDVLVRFPGDGDSLGEDAKQRFLSEAAVIGRLDQPNLTAVVDFGLRSDGQPFFVTEYAEGLTLQQARDNLQPTLLQGVHLMVQVARALSCAHRNGIAHRNLQADQVRVSDNGRVYIIDFGGAWLEAVCSGDPDTSPNAAVDAAADIQAFGSIMCAFFSSDAQADDPVRNSAGLKGLPKPLVALILRCLAPEPARRPASVEQIAVGLLRLLDGEHIMPSNKAEAYAAVGGQTQRFKLLDLIRHNRYGSVFLFNDEQDGRLLVAKKRMGTHAGLRHARQLKKMSEKHIVNIVGVSNKRDTFVVLMEYMMGGGLSDRLARPWTRANFLPVALDMCIAMQKAHEEGLVHGNLRPSNILLDENGRVKVSDFGYSKHYIGHDERDWYQPLSRLDASVQRDVYSAGVIFHHMLTAKLPLVQYGLLVADAEFEKLDTALQTLVRGMIEMQSVNHFTDFHDVHAALRDLSLGIESGPSSIMEESRKRRGKWISVAVILAGLAGAGVGAFLMLR